jgi:acetoin utilization protein AcuB
MSEIYACGAHVLMTEVMGAGSFKTLESLALPVWSAGRHAIRQDAMTQAIPIRKYMTATPHSVGAEQSLVHAAAAMDKYGVRHLPVLHGGKLVGILSDRDLRIFEAMKDVKPELVTVSDAMTSSVYAVSPETSLHEVVRQMAEHKYGSAVVMQHDKVVGIFTTVDVCKALLDLVPSA